VLDIDKKACKRLILMEEDDLGRDSGIAYSAKQLAKLTGVTTHRLGHWVRKRIIPRTTPAGPNTAFTEEHRLRVLAFVALRIEGWDLRGATRQLHAASPAQIRELASRLVDDATIEGFMRSMGRELPEATPDAQAAAASAETASQPVETVAAQPVNVIAVEESVARADEKVTQRPPDVQAPAPAVTHHAPRADTAPSDVAATPADASVPPPYSAAVVASENALWDSIARAWESTALCPGVFLVVRFDADAEARRVAEEIQRAYVGHAEDR
jgi:DNA-binding transcriptional MerR regulator